MKKATIRRAIFGNILAISIASVMLVASTFAWFTLTDNTNTTQTLIIGNFLIDLYDTSSEYALTHSIDVTGVVPMTRDLALAADDNVDGKRDFVYKFTVDNKGIDAKYRMDIGFTETATSGSKTVTFGQATTTATGSTEFLSSLFSFQVRYSTTTEAAVTSATWAPAPTGSAGSYVYNKLNTIGSYFDTLLVNGETSTAVGSIASGDVHYYEVFVWLNQDIELEDIYGLLAGTDLEDEGDSCTFTVEFEFTMIAMQAAGGVLWSDII